MAWARHAAAMGLCAAEIRAELMRARDLSKKGNLKRQREYAERTADKAVRQAELGREMLVRAGTGGGSDAVVWLGAQPDVT